MKDFCDDVIDGTIVISALLAAYLILLWYYDMHPMFMDAAWR